MRAISRNTSATTVRSLTQLTLAWSRSAPGRILRDDGRRQTFGSSARTKTDPGADRSPMFPLLLTGSSSASVRP